MRIVGGKFRGRQLIAPAGSDVRPTSDRVRESVFNILAHGLEGFELAGRRVIDLFAGTGALGLEALSRGAAYCLFVEEAPEARAVIRQNIEAFGLMGVTRIFRRDACNLGPSGNMATFSVAFLDPPYGKGLGDAALISLKEGGWLDWGAVVVLEERAGRAISLPEGYVEMDCRTWGHTSVHFLRFGALP
jgi:16S rRNA (guanine966-N2)-methyltransferase